MVNGLRAKWKGKENILGKMGLGSRVNSIMEK